MVALRLWRPGSQQHLSLSTPSLSHEEAEERKALAFGYMALTFFGSAFQRIHLAVELVTLLTRSYNPQCALRLLCEGG
jgi:hypothetical protein